MQICGNWVSGEAPIGSDWIWLGCKWRADLWLAQCVWMLSIRRVARTACGRTSSALGLTQLISESCAKDLLRAVNDFHASLALKCNAFWLRFCVYLFIAAWSSPDYPTWACPVVLLPPLKVSLIYSLQNDPRLSVCLLPTP